MAMYFVTQNVYAKNPVLFIIYELSKIRYSEKVVILKRKSTTLIEMLVQVLQQQFFYDWFKGEKFTILL